MKIHTKKKAYRAALHKMTKEGYINNSMGTMVPRNQIADNSMRRDYYPQTGK